MAEVPVERQGLKGQRTVRFGPFELCLDTGELRKHGVRVRLQGKPFHILSALIEDPGHVVTREELRARLWPADTFVDFESGLNTAVNRLRIALGDSAENPVYIETLARLGYRFIATVDVPFASKPIASVRELHLREVERPEATPTNAQSVPSVHPNRFSLFSGHKRALFGGLLVIAVLELIGAAVLFPLRASRAEPVFHQVTFRKGFITDARFTPDGGNIVFSAQWNGEPSRLFLASTVSPEARDLKLGKAWLGSISSTAELAVFTNPGDSKRMELERIPLNGGAPRFISDQAAAADWAPDQSLCIVTEKDGISSLEFPAGRKLYVARGYITSPRVSPQGGEVAFLEHPVFGDDAGQVVVVDSSRQVHVLSSGWASAVGLAWNPSGREVWFTATRAGANRALMAVDLGGHLRQISQVPGGLELKDIASSGKVLIARNVERMTMFVGNLSEESERDISWLDWSRAVAIRADGKAILFDESGEGGGRQYSVYLYRVDADSSERLGEGRAMDLSADGQWALTQNANDPTKLTLISVNAAQPAAVRATGISYRWAKFFPDSKEILFNGNYPKQGPRIYRQRLPDGNPILVKAGLQLDGAVINATGQIAVGCNGSQPLVLDLSSGDVRSINTPQCVSPVTFVDPQTLLTTRQENGSFILELLDVKSGRARPYRRFKPPDSTGVMYTSTPHVAADLQTFVYSRQQDLSDLFLVSGWK